MLREMRLIPSGIMIVDLEIDVNLMTKLVRGEVMVEIVVAEADII